MVIEPDDKHDPSNPTENNLKKMTGDVHMCGPGVYRCWPHGDEPKRNYGIGQLVVRKPEETHKFCRKCICLHVQKLNSGVKSIPSNGFSIKCIKKECSKSIIFGKDYCAALRPTTLNRATQLAINDLVYRIEHPTRR